MPQKIDKQHTKSFAHMFPFPYLFVESSDLTFLCLAFPLVHTFFMFQSFCFLSLVTKYILFFSLPSCHQENHNDGFHTFAKTVADGYILLNTPASEVKQKRACVVLAQGTGWEVLRVLSALLFCTIITMMTTTYNHHQRHHH